MTTRPRVAFALCINNGEYEGDLIVGKVYRIEGPAGAGGKGPGGRAFPA